MSHSLTPRDLDVLDALTLRVRMLTLRQVAEIWWPNGRNVRRARIRLDFLVAAKLIEIHRVNAHPPLPVAQPLLVWEPSTAPPNFEQLAAICHSRWRKPSVPVSICVASTVAANAQGSASGGLPRGQRRNHDLRIASVYSSYRRLQPHLTGFWIGNHSFHTESAPFKTPDAVLQHPLGQLIRVINSIGRSSVEQIHRFHVQCETHQLPYELW